LGNHLRQQSDFPGTVRKKGFVFSPRRTFVLTAVRWAYRQLELMISRIGSTQAGGDVWRSYIQLLRYARFSLLACLPSCSVAVFFLPSRTSGMEDEIEEVKEAHGLLEKRDVALLHEFSLRRKLLWKRVVTEEADEALKDLMDAYDAEIARTESEISGLIEESESDALAVLLDLGVDHSLYLLTNLLSKLVRLRQDRVDQELQSTLLKVTMRLSGYLTTYAVHTAIILRIFVSLSMPQYRSRAYRNAAPSSSVAATSQVESVWLPGPSSCAICTHVASWYQICQDCGGWRRCGLVG
jgi:hypothetical protein